MSTLMTKNQAITLGRILLLTLFLFKKYVAGDNDVTVPPSMPPLNIEDEVELVYYKDKSGQYEVINGNLYEINDEDEISAQSSSTKISSTSYDDTEIWDLINRFDNWKTSALYGKSSENRRPTLSKMHYIILPIWWSDENATDPSLTMDPSQITAIMDQNFIHYKEMSWNKMSVTYEILPQTQFPISKVSPSFGDTGSAFSEILNDLGLVVDVDYNGKMLIYHRADQSPFNNGGGWGTVNGRNTWMQYTIHFGVTRHEVGHNAGHPHHVSDSYLYRTTRPEKGEGTVPLDGWDLMSGGNGYSISDYSAAAKWFWNWIPDTSIIKMQPMGATSSCSDCVSGGNFTLWSFDSRDVAPTPDIKMGVFIPLTVSGNTLYSYWLSYRGTGNNGGAAKGLSIHVNWFSLGGIFGCTFDSLNYDAFGDTSTTTDSFVEEGTCYHLYPSAFMKDREINAVENIQPIICVHEIVVGHNISFSVEFLDKNAIIETTHEFEIQETKLQCTTARSTTGSVEVSHDKYTLIHIDDVGYDGEVSIDLCTSDLYTKAYLYDVYPQSLLSYNSEPAYGSYMSLSNNFFNCCEQGTTITVLGAKVVQVKQNQAKTLRLGEIQIYDSNGINIAPSSAKCYSYSVAGYWGGDSNCLNDGLTTETGSCGSYSTGGTLNNYDYCELNEPTDITRVVVYPLVDAPWWHMNDISDIQLNIYAYVEGTSGSAQFFGEMATFQLQEFSSSKRDPQEQEITLAFELSCPDSTTSVAPISITYMSVFGETYITLPPPVLSGAATTFEVSCSFSECLPNEYMDSNRCHMCPANHISPKGSTSSAACEACPGGTIRKHDLVDSCELSKSYDKIYFSKGWRLWSSNAHVELWYAWSMREVEFYSDVTCKADSKIPNTGTAFSSGGSAGQAFGGGGTWHGRRDSNNFFYVGMMYDELVSVRCVKIENGGSSTSQIRVQALNAQTNMWENAFIIRNYDTTDNAVNIIPLLYDDWSITFDHAESSNLRKGLILFYYISCERSAGQVISTMYNADCTVEMGDDKSVVALNTTLQESSDIDVFDNALVPIHFDNDLLKSGSFYNGTSETSGTVSFCVKNDLLLKEQSNFSVAFIYTQVVAHVDFAASSIRVEIANSINLEKQETKVVEKDYTTQLDACLCNFETLACTDTPVIRQNKKFSVCVTPQNYSMSVKAFHNVAIYQGGIIKFEPVQEGVVSSIATVRINGNTGVIKTRLVTEFFTMLDPLPVYLSGDVYLNLPSASNNGRKLKEMKQTHAKFGLHVSLESSNNALNNMNLIVFGIVTCFAVTFFTKKSRKRSGYRYNIVRKHDEIDNNI